MFFFCQNNKKTFAADAYPCRKDREPRQLPLSGSPLWVGGELLSHVSPQYHRRGGA